VRVPTLVWWPGRIPSNAVCDAVAGTIDVLPTAVALAGAQLPQEPTVDGRDLTPLLLGRSNESPREAHYFFLGFNLEAVRQGPWKLALGPQTEGMGMSVPADATNAAPRLYHLGVDVGERNNVAGAHPEVVNRLQSLAARMEAQIGGKSPAARRPAGKIARPTLLYPSDDTRRGAPALNKRKSDPGAA
jgi:arylsulfatase A-like enzyme